MNSFEVWSSLDDFYIILSTPGDTIVSKGESFFIFIKFLNYSSILLNIY